MAAKGKSSVKIAPGAIVCDECELQGDITIGTRTVIHPKAKIIAEAGPIIIGENNIIEELSCIINRPAENATPGGTQAVMIIGNNNVFEVGSYIEAVKIGDHNVVEARANVGRHVVLTSGCIIGAACSVTSNEDIEENSVIYGANCDRRVQKERPPPCHWKFRKLFSVSHPSRDVLVRNPEVVSHVIGAINQAQTLQIDFLTKILPNYHYLKKPSKQTTPQRA